MICTFGDITTSPGGASLSLPFAPCDSAERHPWHGDWGEQDGSRRTPRPTQAYDQLAGQSINKARTKWSSAARKSGAMIGEPRPIMHNVKFYEKAIGRSRS